MQVTETAAEGLKREFRIVVPAARIQEQIESKLKELSTQVRIPGFRPGKVPMGLLRKKYGTSVWGEVLEAAVNDGAQQAIEQNSLRPAMQPKIEIVAAPEQGDLEFTVAVETLPEITTMDFKTIALDKPKVSVPEEEVEKALGTIAERQEKTEAAPEGHKAESGDVAVIDFLGKKDGVPFEGGKAEGYSLKLGSNTFIPGFEDQVIGMAAGESKTVAVTFPEQYQSAELAGQPAEFDVTVHEVRKAVPAALDDELAKAVGLESLDALRTAIREELERGYTDQARVIMKRKLLDILADNHDFTVPQGMVEAEFEAIWKQIEQDKAAGRLDAADAAKSEEELRAEYRTISERRVRLGLLLAEVGRKSEITVTQDDVNRAIMAEARRFPGQEHFVFQYYQRNPDALNMLRAPIYEDKVVDFILELANTTEKPVSPEELAKLAEEADKAQA